jgi:hypothetical protein
LAPKWSQSSLLNEIPPWIAAKTNTSSGNRRKSIARIRIVDGKHSAAVRLAAHDLRAHPCVADDGGPSDHAPCSTANPSPDSITALCRVSCERHLRSHSGLWIRTSLSKQGVQSLVMTVDIVKKVHRTVLLRDRSHVQNKHRDFYTQVDLAIVSA